MNSAKERYKLLCEAEPTIPVFNQYWWLDAVCGENSWDVVLTENKEGITAALPFMVVRKAGFRLLKMPKLTSYLGPWIKYPPDQKYASRLGHETEILKELIAQLPSFDYYSQRFHHSITNWLPFYWKGFKQTTRYTYTLSLDDLDNVFLEFKSNMRGKIRKAAGLVTVTHDKSFADFFHLMELTYERQKISMPHSAEVVERIEAALEKAGQRKIFFAVDAEGRIHSALYLVWDKQSAYMHMLGEDPQLRNSGAGILLAWEAMQYTKKELGLNRFDFLGSMIEPIEIVRRSLGGRQVPYFHITKVRARSLRFFFGIKDAFN